MRAWVFIAALVFRASNLWAAESLQLNYDALGSLIKRGNRSVQGFEEATEASRQRVGSVEQTFLPKLGFETGLAEQREANGVGDTAPFWKIDVQSNIYRGGRDRLSVLVRESQVMIKDMDTQAQFRSELFKAKIDYIRLSHIRQSISLLRNSTGDYDSLRRSIREKAKSGLMTTTLADTLQLESDNMRRELIVLEAEESETEHRLNLVVGAEPDQKIQLATNFTRPRTLTKSKAQTSSLETLPEIKRIELLRESLRLESNVQREWWKPDISVFASYTGFQIESDDQMRSLPERELTLGLRLTVDLESRRYLDAEIAAKKSEVSSFDSQKEYLAREIEHKMHEFQTTITMHSRLLETYDESLDKTTRLLKKLRSEFERGIGGTSELSGLIHSAFELQRKRIDSSNEFWIATAGLETMSSF